MWTGGFYLSKKKCLVDGQHPTQPNPARPSPAPPLTASTRVTPTVLSLQPYCIPARVTPTPIFFWFPKINRQNICKTKLLQKYQQNLAGKLH